MSTPVEKSDVPPGPPEEIINRRTCANCYAVYPDAFDGCPVCALRGKLAVLNVPTSLILGGFFAVGLMIFGSGYYFVVGLLLAGLLALAGIFAIWVSEKMHAALRALEAQYPRAT